MNTVKKGRVGEAKALTFYKKSGYKEISTNWYCQYGELDLILLKGTVFTFVEVKYRQQRSRYPIITKYKLSKLRRTIYLYLEQTKIIYTGWKLEAFYIVQDVQQRKLITEYHL